MHCLWFSTKDERKSGDMYSLGHLIYAGQKEPDGRFGIDLKRQFDD